MTLLTPVGVWFSELKDKWEERDFFYMDAGNRRKNGKYRRYGSLPDGRHYGVWFSPCHDPWPSKTEIQLVEETGQSKVSTSAEAEDWNVWHWPLAVAASPDGKSLVWLIEGLLWAWQADSETGQFLIMGSHCVTNRLGGRKIRDARMHTDGILELLPEDGSIVGYLCDTDTLLLPYEDGWAPMPGETWRLREAGLDSCPESVFAMICEDDDWAYYSGRGVRRVCFEPGLKTVPGLILENNPELKSVVIPASVQRVEYGAFLDCTNLRELVIEGDLSRIVNWDEGAFEGCPCEEYYLEIRNAK